MVRHPDIQTPPDWTALFGQLFPILHSHEALRPQGDGPQAAGASALTLWQKGACVPPARFRGGPHLHTGAESAFVHSRHAHVVSNSHTLNTAQSESPGAIGGALIQPQ